MAALARILCVVGIHRREWHIEHFGGRYFGVGVCLRCGHARVEDEGGRLVP